MQKENRRVKMTKAMLNESFLKYLEEKPISRITVKEICEDADVNRSTYYVYYSDPYDQLHKIEDALIQEQAVYIDAILKNGERVDPAYGRLQRGAGEVGGADYRTDKGSSQEK